MTTRNQTMNRLLLFIALIGLCQGVRAQQDPMLSHYMFNGLFLNPAYAGSHKYASATFVHRNQWVGFDGAPKTNVLGVDGSVLNKRLGLGLVFANDNVGSTGSNNILLNAAYHVKVSEKGKLSFGISGGMYNSIRRTPFAWDGSDPALAANSFWAPKFGFGVYYYTKKSYLGFSIPTLIGKEPTKKWDADLDKFTFMKRHYLLTGGYVFDVGTDIMLKPSFLVKYLPGAPVQADLNVNALFRETVWLGVSYRTNDAVVALLEYQLTRQLRIGGSYDYSFTKLGRLTNGSFEIMLGYDFGSDIMKIKNPRYF